MREQHSTAEARVAAIAGRQHGVVTHEQLAACGFDHLVGFFFADQRIAVETDGWAYHRGSVAMEDDHARDLALRAQGIQTRRYTGAQLEIEPRAVAADLRAQLTPAGLTISRR